MRIARWTPLARRPAAARGFTLLEVLVTALIASVIFLLLGRWVMGLGAISVDSLETSSAERAASYVEERLTSDLTSATVCDRTIGNPIRELSADALELYITSTPAERDADPRTYWVRWEIEGNTLTREQRLVDPDGAECGAGTESYGKRVVVDNVAAGGRTEAAFTGFASGSPVEGCTKEEDAGRDGDFVYTGEGCFAQAIEFNVPTLTIGDDPTQFKAQGTVRLPVQEGAL